MKELLKRQIECDLQNLQESENVPGTGAYRKRLVADIRKATRDIGRADVPIRLNRIAFERGEAWLNSQGVEL